ncbi:MAG: Holliday junction resolvase RuvX [Gammaproteobacteria bacterium]|nr:Holliday junction resolvase RuvX [Gammaproteobacteria bacterium]
MTLADQEIPPRVVLGFDFGEKRIGVAVGQELTGQARGLTTLSSKNRQPDWESISRLIEEWRPNLLIVGRPLHMDGTEQPLTHLAYRFGNRLSGRYNLPVEHVDERLSSYEAEQELSEESKIFTKSDIDKRAAEKILQSWLDNNRRLSAKIDDKL